MSLGVFLLLLRLRASRMATGIRISRIAPARAHERDRVTVKYEIANQSGQVLDQIVLVDRFSGSRTGVIKVFLSSRIKPGGRSVESVEVICDGGMGEHKFGPLEVLVSDPLGLFEYKVVEDTLSALFVFPKIQELPVVALQGSKESLMYGIYEVAEKGGSSNFIGVREYVPGDPIKQISWKLTAKHSRLLVKEFEKITSAEVTVLLDMEGRFHAGIQAESTWEYARDITLGLTSQQTGLGNSIQVLSQTGYIPWGRGSDHCHYVTRCMPDFLPGPVERNLVDTYWEMIPRSSTVFYIGAAFPDEVSTTLKSLSKLKFKDIQVYSILLDGNSFIQNKMFGVLFNVLVLSPKQKDSMNKLTSSLRLAGINTVMIRNKENVGRSLLRLEAS